MSTARRTPAKKTPARKVAAKPAHPRSTGPAVAIAGSVLKVDPEELTLGELEDFEEACGRPLEEMMRGEVVVNDKGEPVKDSKGKTERTVRPRIREIRALVWLVKRRDDPAFTFEMARDVRVNELQLGSDPQ